MNRATLAAIVLAMIAGPLLPQDAPDSVLRGTKRFRRQVLASGLSNPWEVTWGPDNRLWVTESSGKRVIRIDPSTGERTVAATIDEASAPGVQQGVLGLALHPDLLKNSSNNYVYVSYTYVDKNLPPDPYFTDPESPYRFLYMKLVRFTYDPASGTLSDRMDLVTALPTGNDHVAGRLKFGPDRKLYLTIGDQGNNQLGNFCVPIEAQRLPTAAEIRSKNYIAYVGKSLRLNLDGSIPADNPRLAGVVSHVYTYGHRNPQGIDFGPDGTLYESEHGPKTDDEVNILKAGSNYGWPNVAGLRDSKAYEYARWAEASTPCSQLRFTDLEIHPSVPRESETAFTKPFVPPIATMFTVPSDYKFHDPVCGGIDFICWPTVGASSIEYYASKGTGIPGWDKVLFVTTLKRGSLYVLPLSANGQTAGGKFSRYFQSENRYRDTAVSADGKTIYIATDSGGLTEAMAGGATRTVQNPGSILAFTYEADGPAGTPDEPVRTSTARPSVTAAAAPSMSSGKPPAYTAQQAAAGRKQYDANCAVCHGSTMTNGTFGTPLAGEYFRNAWTGKTVRALLEKARTMPPAAPHSLPAETYTNVVAYILELNGFKPGDTPLAPAGDALEGQVIR